MSKYDNIKFLKETKARKPRICDKCGCGIESGKIYYKESIGKINVIGIKLNGFCEKCYQEQGNKLIARRNSGR